MTKEGMKTTSTTYIVQLTQPLRLGAWVAPPQQQTQKNGAFFTTRHFYRKPGSSQASCSTIGTTPRCNITTEGDTGPPYMPSLLLPPTTAVELQHSSSEGSEAEAEGPSSKPRQPQRAALHQRELLRGLVEDDLIYTYLPLEGSRRA